MNAWLLRDIRTDAAMVLRAWRRTPSFTIVALTLVTLGIGVNTLIFSVVNALVLRPLPVEDPQRLVFIQSSHRGNPGQSFPNYRDLREYTTAFEGGIIGYRVSPIEFDSGSAPMRIWGYLATDNYFGALRLAPATGRLFTAADRGSAVVVISSRFWRSHFGGNPAVIGRAVRLNRRTFTIVGVAPEGFEGTEVFFRPDVWVPMERQPDIEVGNPWLENRGTFNVWMVGRLAEGVSEQSALEQLNAVAGELERQHPGVNKGLHFALARPGLIGDALGRPVRMFILGILVVASMLLLTACANLAGMLSARSLDRQKEFALRVALGARVGRLGRQLVTETLMMTLVGGALGALLAELGATALGHWKPPVDFPISLDVSVDPLVLAYGLVVSVITGIFVAVAPVRRAFRIDPSLLLKGGVHASGSRTRWSIRDGMVALQVAGCFVLLSASSVGILGLKRAFDVPLGFEPEGLSMVGFDLALNGYAPERGEQFQKRAFESLSRLPGVTSVGYGSSIPLNVDQSATGIRPDTRPDLAGRDVPTAVRYQVSPGFLETLRVRLLDGRLLTWSDIADMPQVAVVNRTFAESIMGGSHVIGRTFRIGGGDIVEIVGVVENGKYQSLTESARAAVFVPILQRYSPATVVVVRSATPAGQMVEVVRRAVAQEDPGLSLYSVGTVEDMLGFARFPSQMAALSLSAFGLLAVALAVTGIYGMVAYAVARRQKDIAIRLSLGAGARDVLRTLLGRLGAVMLVGTGIGLALSLAMISVLQNALGFGGSNQAVLLLMSLLLVVAAAVCACVLPIRKAFRVPLVAAIRAE